jgi:P4 family phage/plasmid primase-like protien
METDNVLREAKRLYDVGFSILLLHPKSKRPIETGWTKGARKPWDEIKKQYRPGLNLGVRLGETSRIKDGFLGVIDVDVKSNEERHAKEALNRVRCLTKLQTLDLPRVNSGRGNGSRHFYFISDAPLTPYKAAQSDEIVKVPMPSVKPSKRDLAALTPAEIDAGLRLRPAWEVSVMGEGQQVVLPPSIHPDSGRAYIWGKPFEVKKLNLTKPETAKIDQIRPNLTKSEKPGPKVALDGFEIVPFDLLNGKVPDHVADMILSGKGVSDRSAALLPVTSALVRAGLTRNEILSVLTDEQYFLSDVAYDHAKTKDRVKAARWLYKYTVEKVMRVESAAEMFREPLPPTAEVQDVTANEKSLQAFKDEIGLHGFYYIDDNDKRWPDYGALLRHFEMTHPFKTIADMKSVFVFDKTHYRHLTPIEIKAFAEDNFDPRPLEKTRAEFLSKVMASNVECKNFFIDTIKGKINFKNGVLTLGDGFMSQPVLEPHSPAFGFQAVLPYDYDPEADCPFFRNWIHQIMLGDPDLIAVLQEFMGYIVRGGEYRFHKALWLGGRGRNGKSTFIDLLKALIGSDNFSTISIKALVNDRFAGAELDGRLANFSEETSPQELADSGPFKNLTGDGEISAQRKFGAPYKFRNRAKLVMSYNQIPDLRDPSDGMMSRPLIVPFELKIREAEQDHRIKEKLFAELSGIFNFALEGWERLELQNHFTKSEKSAKAMQAVREESCNVFQWIENYLKFNDDPSLGGAKSARELYENYQTREKKFYFRYHEFGRRLNTHPELKKRWKHTRNGKVYLGVDFV